MSTGILLDADIIIALTSKVGERRSDAEKKMKVTSLTCDEFLITGTTLYELRGYVERFRSPTADLIELDIHALRDLISSKRIRNVDRSEILQEENKDFFDQIVQKVQLAKPNKRGSWAFIDASLLLASRDLKLPILTLDKSLKRLFPHLLPKWYAPLPFDLRSLRKISLYELMDISQILREIYTRSFYSYKVKAEYIKEDVKNTREAKELALDYKNQLIQTTAQVNELKEEILDRARGEEFWRKAAKPDTANMICWKMIEIKSDFVPASIHTLPVSYFIDLWRNNQHLKVQKSENAR